jgi:hypothetical protein
MIGATDVEIMLITSVLLSLGKVPLLAPSVTLVVPTVVGVPEIVAPESVNPAGSSDAVYVIGVDPLAEMGYVNGVLTAPLAVKTLVIRGAVDDEMD